MKEYRKEKTQEEVRQVAEMLNNMSFDSEGFCELFCNEHRTLQQSFTTLCIEWLKTCAKDEYRTDGRNEDSKRVAKLMLEGHEDEVYVRFI